VTNHVDDIKLFIIHDLSVPGERIGSYAGFEVVPLSWLAVTRRQYNIWRNQYPAAVVIERYKVWISSLLGIPSINNQASMFRILNEN
jgi:hypothetical protein